MSATLNEQNVGGYSVAYVRDDIYFPVYVTAALAAIFFTVTWITGALYWLALAVLAGVLLPFIPRFEMAKAVTIKVKLVSSADTGFYYVAKKNSRTMTDKLVKKKYDPVAKKHVEFRESKIK